eukprot:10690127-Prorocentrum_lima.AAC.1
MALLPAKLRHYLTTGPGSALASSSASASSPCLGPSPSSVGGPKYTRAPLAGPPLRILAPFR